jgi:hypothetical protein
MEVRSTANDLLERADISYSSPPTGSPTHESVLSIVLEASVARNKVRRLPALYMGNAHVFSDRRIDLVLDRFERTARMLQGATSKPTYLLHPCRIDGLVGLYARDVYSRSTYRMKLRRLGLEFSDDFFVTFDQGGRLSSERWGPLDISFVIVGVDDEDPTKTTSTTGAYLSFILSSWRVGLMDGEELRWLNRAFSEVEGLSAGDPLALAESLRRRAGSGA